MQAVVTAMPNDGVLDTIFLKCTSRLKAAGMITPYTKGKYRRFPKNFILKRLRKIEIRSGDPLLVDLDGEVFFDTSLTVEIIPEAVKIVAPGGAVYEKRMDLDE